MEKSTSRLSSLWFPALIAVACLAGLAACARRAGGETPGPAATLRIAVLPILDALPLYVAEEQGYFEANGVDVEFIPVSSAAERDQLIAAGQADGMINDGVSTVLYNRDEVQIQIVRFARTASSEFPQFRILVSADSGVDDVMELKGVEIGISEGTVIEYLTDRLLQAEGFAPDEIETVSVPRIPDRLALLSSGELKAAMLPDPLSSLAVQGGARVILDDTKHPEFGYSVISFVTRVIEEHPEAVRGFLAALEQAVADINGDPNRWDTLLSDRSLVPQPLIGSYQLPVFPTASVPSRAQFADVVAWAREKGLISGEVPYEGSVNSNFLP